MLLRDLPDVFFVEAWFFFNMWAEMWSRVGTKVPHHVPGNIRRNVKGVDSRWLNAE